MCDSLIPPYDADVYSDDAYERDDPKHPDFVDAQLERADLEQTRRREELLDNPELPAGVREGRTIPLNDLSTDDLCDLLSRFLEPGDAYVYAYPWAKPRAD